jgi:hypothetical protein
MQPLGDPSTLYPMTSEARAQFEALSLERQSAFLQELTLLTHDPFVHCHCHAVFEAAGGDVMCLIQHSFLIAIRAIDNVEACFLIVDLLNYSAFSAGGDWLPLFLRH